jgi:hypothetical protein
MFFHWRNPAMLICWTMGQQAFNAAMILLLDNLETGNDSNWWMVEQAYAVFVQLSNDGVHSLAQLAQERMYAVMEQIKQRDEERARRASDLMRQPMLAPDTAPMIDLSGDTVMSSTGMFLLEDHGLQSTATQYPGFRSWGWTMAPESSAHPSNPSGPPTPEMTSSMIPVSEISAAPFPVLATAPITPFAVGLQPRMAPVQHTPIPIPDYSWHQQQQPVLQTTMPPPNLRPMPNPHQHNVMQHQMYQYQASAQYQQSQYHQQQRPQPIPVQQPQQQHSFSQVRGLRPNDAPQPVQHVQSAITGGRPHLHSRQQRSARTHQRRNR